MAKVLKQTLIFYPKVKNKFVKHIEESLLCVFFVLVKRRLLLYNLKRIGVVKNMKQKNVLGGGVSIKL